jgi:hypothetical protein
MNHNPQHALFCPSSPQRYGGHHHQTSAHISICRQLTPQFTNMSLSTTPSRPQQRAPALGDTISDSASRGDASPFLPQPRLTYSVATGTAGWHRCSSPCKSTRARLHHQAHPCSPQEIHCTHGRHQHCFLPQSQPQIPTHIIHPSNDLE